MKLIIISFFTLFAYLNATNLGTIATGSKTGGYYKLATDISMLFKNYGLQLKPIASGGSYENLETLNGVYTENKNTFFAIVQKDAISYYNYFQFNSKGKSIYSKLPVVLSLGIEQIHILANEDAEFDFERRKTYKIRCGSNQGGSCITAKYIEKAYGFNFVYVNISSDQVVEKLQDGTIDLAFSVIVAPAIKFKNLEGVKLIDLPTNFVMEDMYTHSILKKKDYPWMEEDIHAFAVPKVLITNLSDKKYEPIIENMVKILILNKRYLAKEFGEYWHDIDFYDTRFKKMSKASKRVIADLQSK